MDFIDRLSCNVSNVTWPEFFIASAIIILSFFLRKVLARGVVRLFSHSNKQDVQLKVSILESIFKPLSFTIVILGIYVANLILPLSLSWSESVQSLLKILSTLILFWGVFNILVPLFFYLQHNHHRRTLRQEFYYFMFRLSRILVIVLGVVTALEMWGINVFAFVAGLGLVGAAVAFAAQDTLKNIFASLSLLIEETFHQGDTIKTKDIEGTVEHIGFRKTSIRQADKSLVSVPNSSLTDSPIINLSRMNMRQVKFAVQLDYSTTVDQLRQITEQMRSYILNSPDFETNPKKAPIIVCIESLTAISIKLSCECYTKTNNYLEFCKIRENLILVVMKIVGDLGASFADAKQNIIIDQNKISLAEEHKVIE